LVGLPVTFFVTYDIYDSYSGNNYGFECINQIPYREDSIKVYRINGGATTPDQNIVRRERHIFPGILKKKEYIRITWDTLGVRILDGDSIEITCPRMENYVITTVPL